MTRRRPTPRLILDHRPRAGRRRRWPRLLVLLCVGAGLLAVLLLPGSPVRLMPPPEAWLTALRAGLAEPVAEPTALLRERFLAAEAAWADDDLETFTALAADLQDYPLWPYLRANQLTRDLRTADPALIGEFLATYGASTPAELVRRPWLALLARQQRWADFLAAYRDNGSVARACLQRRALHATGRPGAFAALDAVYLTARSLPDACDPLFAAWFDAGGLTTDLVWARIELALARGNTGVAAFQRRYLPSAEQPWLEQLLVLHREPQRLMALSEEIVAIPDPDPRDALLGHGLARLARVDAPAASAAWTALTERLQPSRRLREQTTVAIGSGFTRHDEAQALAWLDDLEPRADNLDLQVQRLQSALALTAWDRLAEWAAALPADAGDLGEWRYWQGRALLQQGELRAAAHAFAAAAEARSLWGFLAADLLGRPPALGHRPVPVVDPAALGDPGLPARLAELQALGRTAAIRREWRDLSGGLHGDALRAAAALASQLGLHHDAIMALVRADDWDDLTLRFPLAYRDLVSAAASAHGLPADWIFAVIRQESAFQPGVASPAGAVGLMQLMPATAAEVARRAGRDAPGRTALTDPALNIDLGSRYLAQMRARFRNHPLPATAAYNAGPGAVRRWLPETPLAGDLWMVRIPYRETREYVRRVLMYQVIYRDRLGLPPLRPWAMMRPVGRG